MSDNLGMEEKRTAALLRKLQNKLRKQRHDLDRTHQYNLQQKLKEQSDRYENEMQSTQSMLEAELLKQNNSHEEALQSLKKEHQNQIAEKENEMNEIQEEAQTQYDNLQQSNDALTSRIHTLQQENTQLQAQLDQVMQQKEAQSKTMKDDAANIQNEIITWISTQQSHNTSIKTANFEEIETKLSNINKKAKQFMDNRLNIWNEATKDVDSMRSELDQKQQIIKDRNNELAQVRKNLQQKTAKLDQMEAHYEEDLIRDVNEYKIRMQNMNTQMDSEIEQKEKAKAELSDVMEENNHFAQHIKEIEKQNCAFEVQDHHNQQIIQEMKSKLDKKEEILDKHRQHVLSLQMELQNTILIKKDVARQLAEKSDQLLESKTKLAMTQASSRKQINVLESELQDALTELRSKANDCQRLRERVEVISDRLKTRLN
eukprot:134058_1